MFHIGFNNGTVATCGAIGYAVKHHKINVFWGTKSINYLANLLNLVVTNALKLTYNDVEIRKFFRGKNPRNPAP